ncbi:MAG: hypothetical protein ACREOI_32745, partial [bacterium]
QQILRYVRNNNIFIQMKNAVMRENSGILCANEAISSVLFGDRFAVQSLLIAACLSIRIDATALSGFDVGLDFHAVTSFLDKKTACANESLASGDEWWIWGNETRRRCGRRFTIIQRGKNVRRKT